MPLSGGWGGDRAGPTGICFLATYWNLFFSYFCPYGTYDKNLIHDRGISWATKDKVQQANYFGSLTQASSIRVGSFNGEEIHAPFKSLLPMVYITHTQPRLNA